MKTFEEYFKMNENTEDSIELSAEELKAKIKGDTELHLFDEVVEDLKQLKLELGKDNPEYQELVKLWHEHYKPELKERERAGTAPEAD